MHQVGTDKDDRYYGVTVDVSGNAIACGTTWGELFGPWLGGPDSTVVKLVSCLADCDGNGALDFFDFLCFQNEFAAATSYADCDNSGALDFFDFLCFQNEFQSGCP